MLANSDELRRQVMGCWLGKPWGGPRTGFRGPGGAVVGVVYDPVPEGMVPNDDLDLQVVWACLMDSADPPRVDRRLLERGWLENIRFPWTAYGWQYGTSSSVSELLIQVALTTGTNRGRRSHPYRDLGLPCSG